MQDHTLLSDDEFLAAFEQCRLPKECWSHEAHVRMAWLYLVRESFERALSMIRNGIRRYNASVSNSPGYHETVTQAYALLIASRVRNGSSKSFDDFKHRYPELFDPQKPILLRHYRKETLDSAEARQGFLPADLEPLPSLG
jgi:hypothetical protein